MHKKLIKIVCFAVICLQFGKVKSLPNSCETEVVKNNKELYMIYFTIYQTFQPPFMIVTVMMRRVPMWYFRELYEKHEFCHHSIFIDINVPNIDVEKLEYTVMLALH